VSVLVRILSDNAVEVANVQALDASINREIVPLLRTVRNVINARFGRTVTPDFSAGNQYIVEKNDEAILADASLGAVSVVLPPPSFFATRRVVVKKIDTNVTTVTVFTGGAGATIDGAASAVIPAFPGSLTFLSDGDLAWYIVAKVT
jgi:hypothetical protein